MTSCCKILRKHSVDYRGFHPTLETRVFLLENSDESPVGLQHLKLDLNDITFK